MLAPLGVLSAQELNRTKVRGADMIIVIIFGHRPYCQLAQQREL